MIRAIAVLLLYAAPLLAQSGASVDVRVVAGSKPLPVRCELILWPSGTTRECDAQGRIVFDELPTGRYRIECAASDYGQIDTAFFLEPGEHLGLILRLPPLAATLPEYTVETRRPEGLVSVFSRRQIEESRAASLADFLTSTAGLEVVSDNGASEACVRIGGSNTNQVLVLVDGRRLVNNASGTADISCIPVSWVESVEVYRGGQPEWGGEAIGGVLNIMTRRPDQRREISAELGTRGAYQNASFFQSGQAGRLNTVLSYARTQGAGNFRYTRTEDDGNGPFTVDLGKSFRRENNQLARDQLLLKVLAPLRNEFSVEATVGLDRESRGMPGYLAPELTPAARQQDQQESFSIRASRPSKPVSLESRASYQRQWRRYTDPDPQSLIRASEESSRMADAEIRAAAIVARTEISTGALVGREGLASKQIMSGDVSRDRWAGWMQVLRSLVNLSQHGLTVSTQAGLRMEGFAEHRAILPRLSISVERSPSYTVGATASWGKSYRAPDFNSLFWMADQVSSGNPDLKPEQSREWTGRAYLETAWSNRLRFEATVSNQHVQDIIIWRQSFDNRWKPFNVDAAHVRTLDLTLEQSFLGDRIHLTGGANWTEARNGTSDINTGGKYLTFRAPRSFRGGLRWVKGSTQCQAAYRWVSARPALETNSKWLSAYQIVDCSLARTFTFRRVSIQPAIGVSNLFGVDYRIIRHAPLPEREFFASLRIYQP